MTYDEAVALAKTGRKVSIPHWSNSFCYWNNGHDEMWWCSPAQEHSAPYEHKRPDGSVDAKRSYWEDVTDRYAS